MPASGPDRLVIAAGEGWLDVLELQQEGREEDARRRVPARRRPDAAAIVIAGATDTSSHGSGVAPARAAAFAALRRLRTSGSRLDDSAAALPELSSLSAADRGLANELVSGTVKRRASIDAGSSALTPKRRFGTPTRMCATRSGSRRSSCSFSTASRPTPPWTTR